LGIRKRGALKFIYVVVIHLNNYITFVYFLFTDAIGTDGRLRGNGAAWRSDPHIIKHTTR